MKHPPCVIPHTTTYVIVLRNQIHLNQAWIRHGTRSRCLDKTRNEQLINVDIHVRNYAGEEAVLMNEKQERGQQLGKRMNRE